MVVAIEARQKTFDENSNLINTPTSTVVDIVSSMKNKLMQAYSEAKLHPPQVAVANDSDGSSTEIPVTTGPPPVPIEVELSKLLMEKGEFKEPVQLLQSALKLQEKEAGLNSERLLPALFLLGKCQLHDAVSDINNGLATLQRFLQINTNLIIHANKTDPDTTAMIEALKLMQSRCRAENRMKALQSLCFSFLRSKAIRRIRPFHEAVTDVKGAIDEELKARSTVMFDPKYIKMKHSQRVAKAKEVYNSSPEKLKRILRDEEGWKLFKWYYKSKLGSSSTTAPLMFIKEMDDLRRSKIPDYTIEYKSQLSALYTKYIKVRVLPMLAEQVRNELAPHFAYDKLPLLKSDILDGVFNVVSMSISGALDRWEDTDEGVEYISGKEMKSAAVKISHAWSRKLRRREKMNATAIKIQKVWRSKKGKEKVREMATQAFTKRFDEESQSYYYVNLLNGTSTWSKPKTLGATDVSVKATCNVCMKATAYSHCRNCSQAQCLQCFNAKHTKEDGKVVAHFYAPLGDNHQSVMCGDCTEKIGGRDCQNCTSLYCDVCFESSHNRGARKKHRWVYNSEMKYVKLTGPLHASEGHKSKTVDSTVSKKQKESIDSDQLW